MIPILLVQIVLLLSSLMMGLTRVILGPTPFDRMLAAQLIGSTGVAILILLAEALAQPALLDVALVFALLAGVAAVTFVQKYAMYSGGAGR